jgi:hypothetical protein
MATKANRKTKIVERPETETTTDHGFEIRSGIPIPPRGANRRSKAREALSKMFAGDSVVTTVGKAQAFRHAAKALGVKVIVRPAPEAGDKMVGVWRE